MKRSEIRKEIRKMIYEQLDKYLDVDLDHDPNDLDEQYDDVDLEHDPNNLEELNYSPGSYGRRSRSSYYDDYDDHETPAQYNKRHPPVRTPGSALDKMMKQDQRANNPTVRDQDPKQDESKTNELSADKLGNYIDQSKRDYAVNNQQRYSGQFDNPDIRNKMNKRIKGMHTAKDQLYKKNQKNELSPDTYSNYIKKSSKSAKTANLGQGATTGASDLFKKYHDTSTKKANKRERGIDRAADQLAKKAKSETKTPQQIMDEEIRSIIEFKAKDLPAGTSWRIGSGKGWAAKNKHGISNYWYGQDAKKNQSDAEKFSSDDKVKSVNELSPNTYSKYIKKSAQDIDTRSWDDGIDRGQTYMPGKYHSPPNNDKIEKRHKGISIAADQLSKKAKKNELSTKKYGQYAKKASSDLNKKADQYVSDPNADNTMLLKKIATRNKGIDRANKSRIKKWAK